MSIELAISTVLDSPTHTDDSEGSLDGGSGSSIQILGSPLPIHATDHADMHVQQTWMTRYSFPEWVSLLKVDLTVPLAVERPRVSFGSQKRQKELQSSRFSASDYSSTFFFSETYIRHSVDALLEIFSPQCMCKVSLLHTSNGSNHVDINAATLHVAATDLVFIDDIQPCTCLHPTYKKSNIPTTIPPKVSNQSNTNNTNNGKNTKAGDTTNTGMAPLTKSAKVFYTIYCLGSLVTAGMYFYNFYVSPFYEILGLWICFAKMFAGLIYFNCALVLLPMCHGIMTKLQRYQSSRRILPLTEVYNIHIICGTTIVLAGLFHAIMHAAGTFVSLSNVPEELCQGAPWCGKSYLQLLLQSHPGWTGVALTVIFLFMLVTSLPAIRKSHFSLFFRAHHIFIVAIPLLFIHGLEEWVQTSHQWRFMCGGTALYVCDRIYRVLISAFTLHTRISKFRISMFPIYKANYLHQKQQSVLQRIPMGSIVPDTKETYIFLSIMKPKNWSHKSGQYLQLQQPALGPQWHPFTIASSNGEEELSLIIKESGKWTKRLREYLAEFGGCREDGSNISKEILCNIPCQLEGPFGAPASSAIHSIKTNSAHQLYFVAGGVGITPFLSIFRDIQGRLKLTLPKVHFLGSKPVWWEHAYLSQVPDVNGKVSQKRSKTQSKKELLQQRQYAWIKKLLLPSQEYTFTNHQQQQLSLRMTHPLPELQTSLPPSQLILNYTRNLPIIRAEAGYLPYTVKEKENVLLALHRVEEEGEEPRMSVKDVFLSPRNDIRRKKEAETQTAAYTPPLLPQALWRFLPKEHAQRRGLRLPIHMPQLEQHVPNIELLWVVRSWHQLAQAQPEINSLVIASYLSQTNERFSLDKASNALVSDVVPKTPLTLKTPLYSSITPRRASVAQREQKLMRVDQQYHVKYHNESLHLETNLAFSLKLDEQCTIAHTGATHQGCLCGTSGENDMLLHPSTVHVFEKNDINCVCKLCQEHQPTTDCMCPQCVPSPTLPEVHVQYGNTSTLPCACVKSEADQTDLQQEIPTNLAHFLRASSRFAYKPVTCITCPALLELAQNPLLTLCLLYPSYGNNYTDSTEHVTSFSHLATNIFPYIDPVSLLQLHAQYQLSLKINNGTVDVFSTAPMPLSTTTDSTWVFVFGRPTQALLDLQLKSGMETYTANQVLNGVATIRSNQALQQIVKQIPDLHESHDTSLLTSTNQEIEEEYQANNNTLNPKKCTNNTLIINYEENNHPVTKTIQMAPCKAEMYCCCPPALSTMVGNSIKGTKKHTESREWTATLYKEHF